ncbi:F-box/LRR-repeat protein 2-like [Phoenix dactylifera]|uniref:F-box/LRR-repeat protein 2-like n=1 Tax=Phoenix dactylifera TaxID=42345 RepID=A0A8B9AMM2_PHODC|nr:F-box/LRR-repeat protein 2-like [Phoenix dactylifera]XP_038985260.1 F-box/LRR-repeat protein 2-like [Phoenix dactylifera]XP_038985261.1 F-box/LRR-repeat protein 2-like [Phoenix dactylifera]XP_038985262.1 F-box/LRR-repeat protein 2-like [Phoenix dactylifera]XP_038985263.1 F-box/LRR-repeat protein 2-like [Phoenix dactylifera]XP_038985264.1 F-box/LRR-repeat protein 2-like [Phoenix dactylifera]XP_038985265.1 F-box/LRR-repeat protein 2-like [Phoenix dactylifera]XP_038985266.1 F-box/LRR-repeat 
MERFGDDLLGFVLKRVTDRRDRQSCSEVSRQWARVEGLTRASLRVLEPAFMPSFLPRFPNLVTLETGKRIPDFSLETVATTCPNLRTLNLNVHLNLMASREFEESELDDVSDNGLRAVAAGCRQLMNVTLRRRKGIADVGVIALARNARNLSVLDLSWCDSITNMALSAISMLSSLTVLCLQGCTLVTDLGLCYLAMGSSSRTLRKLDLSECHQITDTGVCMLSEMSGLQELNLAECGSAITDIGGVALAAVHSLARLDLSYIINLSDVTLFAVARNCRNLVKMNVAGCELITGEGIRSFSGHGSLEILVLVSCCNVSADDVEHTVLACRSLRYVGLDGALRGWMSSSVQEKLSQMCRIDWF